MEYQLRDYRITPGAMEQFVAEWRNSVVPLRRQVGFEMVGAWANAETNRFVWVLAYDGDLTEADGRYYASPDRDRMSPDPARFIETAQHEFVTPVV